MRSVTTGAARRSASVLFASRPAGVPDRENHRVQVFDGNGKYETQWKNLHRPCGLYMPHGRRPICYIGEVGPAAAVSRDIPNLGPRVSIVDHEGRLIGRLATRQPAPSSASSWRRMGSPSTGTATSMSARFPGLRGRRSIRASRTPPTCAPCRNSKRSSEPLSSDHAPSAHGRAPRGERESGGEHPATVSLSGLGWNLPWVTIGNVMASARSWGSAIGQRRLPQPRRRDCFASLAMTRQNECHYEERSDEAISKSGATGESSVWLRPLGCASSRRCPVTVLKLSFRPSTDCTARIPAIVLERMPCRDRIQARSNMIRAT